MINCIKWLSSFSWLFSSKVQRTRGWLRPTSKQPNTLLPRWSVRRCFRAGSSLLTPTSASTETLATSQVSSHNVHYTSKVWIWKYKLFQWMNKTRIQWLMDLQSKGAFIWSFPAIHVFLCVCVWFPGIDLAFIENGFIYHTKYDTADRILTDSIQRAGKQITTSASIRKQVLGLCYYITFIVDTESPVYSNCLSKRMVIVAEDSQHHVFCTKTNSYMLCICASSLSVRWVSILLISSFPSEPISAYTPIYIRCTCPHLPHLPGAVWLDYFALRSTESSQSALKPRDSWHGSSRLQQLLVTSLLISRAQRVTVKGMNY